MVDRRNIAVVGIEGFHLRGTNVVPDMDLIADFSSLESLPWRERCSGSLEASRVFVKEKATKPETLLAFEVQAHTETDD
jgi:outer membrane lipopolysaccharide assembly protein LptE/RlpB